MSFISYLINGISLGSVYAIIALGYTMVYGIAKMLNFAHGDVIMVGGFAVFTIVSTLGLPPVLGILVAVVICTALGMLIERVAYKPLRNASSPLAVLITAIGVSYLLQNVALLIFGANTKSFTSVVTISPLKLADGQLIISGETIMTIIAGIVIMVCLTLFVHKSKAGQAMLAVSEEAGVFAVKSEDNRRFFITGHPEYDPDTLAHEYFRDVDKGLPIRTPQHYFPNDDPAQAPIVNWRSAGQLFYTNWLNYYVYQTTPYDITQI